MPVIVKWLEEKQFVAIDSTGHSVVLSSPADGVGMKPSDLLLVALAGCSAYDVVEILRKKRQKLESLTVKVRGEQESDPPWLFRRIHTTFHLRGDLSEKAVQQAIELSETKYCSVAATLRPAVELTWDHLIES
ncbi:MAG: OsmC family peroxiredoxin [Ardenticatenales bacterium]|jgi:putative redox protein|nr:OsmC family peroxiredoxin [Ardenticatenales bacterium]